MYTYSMCGRSVISFHDYELNQRNIYDTIEAIKLNVSLSRINQENEI